MDKKEQVTLGFREVVNKMAWLNKLKMEDRLKGYTSSEVHYIESIEKTPDPNVTKLAQSLYMTRGAISKMTKKLEKKGIIESYQKPDNKKEIYFRLTEQGRAVYKVHLELHNEFQERDNPVFEQITDQQYDSMLAFLKRYSKHLDEEIKKQSTADNSE